MPKLKNASLFILFVLCVASQTVMDAQAVPFFMKRRPYRAEKNAIDQEVKQIEEEDKKQEAEDKDKAKAAPVTVDDAFAIEENDKNKQIERHTKLGDMFLVVATIPMHS